MRAPFHSPLHSLEAFVFWSLMIAIVLSLLVTFLGRA